MDKDLSVKDLQEGKNIKVKTTVENTGDLPGRGCATYIRDLEASVTRRIKELKGFKKIHLNPGEKMDVIFTLGEEELGIWNSEMEFCVEPGNVKIFVGGNSQDNLEITYTIK